jgi:predicted oxidoreductase (fatty acid repression mutant protein)
LKKTNKQTSGPTWSKICIINKILEQINTFNYVGCIVSYEGEKETPQKVSKFMQGTGSTIRYSDSHLYKNIQDTAFKKL